VLHLTSNVWPREASEERGARANELGRMEGFNHGVVENESMRGVCRSYTSVASGNSEERLPGKINAYRRLTPPHHSPKSKTVPNPFPSPPPSHKIPRISQFTASTLEHTLAIGVVKPISLD